VERTPSDIYAKKIRDLIEQRRMDRPQDREVKNRIRNAKLIKRALEAAQGKSATEEEIKTTIKWLEKVSKFIPIASDRELEEIIKIMIILSKKRAKLNELYDKPGLNLMKRVREGMIRYMVVLSEIRARRKEYLEHWFSDEYWISEWSRILLDLAPENNMVKFGFDDIVVKDFMFLLELELAAADDASRIEKPMIRLQPIENKDGFLIVPTEAAAKEYRVQVDRILDGTLTFTQWVNDTLLALKLPK